MKLEVVDGKTDENCSMILSMERKKIREQLLWNLSINKERNAQVKKIKKNKKKGKYSEKKKRSTHTRRDSTQLMDSLTLLNFNEVLGSTQLIKCLTLPF